MNVEGRAVGHTAEITCMSSHDQIIASGSLDGTVRLWDQRLNMSTGSPQTLMVDPTKLQSESEIEAVAFSEPWSVVVCYGNQLIRFDTRMEGSVQCLLWPDTKHDTQNAAFCHLDARSGHLAVIDEDGYVNCLKLGAHQGEPRAIDTSNFMGRRPPIRTHEPLGSRVCFMGHRRDVFLSGGMDSRLRQWDFSTGQLRCVDELDFTMHTNTSAAGIPMVNPPFVNAIASDQHGVACGLGDGSVVLLSRKPRENKASKWKMSRALDQHLCPVIDVWLPNDARVLSLDHRSRLAIWDRNELKPVKLQQLFKDTTSMEYKVNASTYLEGNGLAVADHIHHDLYLYKLTP